MTLFSGFSIEETSKPTIFGKCASPKKHFDFVMRSSLEHYWSIYKSHAERNFRSGLQGAGFRSRWWEMYLWGRLIKMGFFLSQPKGGMPDICVSRGNQLVYIECISPTSGTGENKIKDTPVDEVFDIPEDEIVLRLASSIYDKNKQAKNRIERVGNSHYIIAIDVSQLAPSGLDDLSVLKAVFPVGQESITLSNNGRTISRELSWRSSVTKKTGSQVGTARFLETKEYCQISGILFCDARFENVAAGGTPQFFIVHNYHASKYLSRKMFRGQPQWEWNGYNSLFCRNHKHY